MRCRDLNPGDLFRIKGQDEVYMWLYQPIHSDDSEINYMGELPDGHPALQDGIFFAVRNDGLPAPEFVLNNDAHNRWENYEIERVNWPWIK